MPPKNTTPTTHADAIALSKTTGTKRSTNPRPNAPNCIAINLKSTIGPTTKNTNCAVGDTAVNDAATNASASEHSDSTIANTTITAINNHGVSASPKNHCAGTMTFTAAASAAPTTR